MSALSEAKTRDAIKNAMSNKSAPKLAQLVADLLDGTGIHIGVKGNFEHPRMFIAMHLLKEDQRDPEEKLGNPLLKRVVELDGYLLLSDPRAAGYGHDHTAWLNRFFEKLEQAGLHKGTGAARHNQNVVAIDLKDANQVKALVSILVEMKQKTLAQEADQNCGHQMRAFRQRATALVGLLTEPATDTITADTTPSAIRLRNSSASNHARG